MRMFIPRFLAAFAYLLGLSLVGMVGYMLIEGWPMHDAFYMSVITITSVGFAEIRPLSQAGRDLTMVLLLGGATGIGIWFALITSLIVEFDLNDVRRRRRIMRSIAALSDHIVVCGGGRTGRQVIEELMALGQEFVVIEQDAKRLAWIQEQHPDVLTVMGDATLDTNLKEAGVDRARGLLTCLSADTENVFVCLSARHLKPDLTIVARALEEAALDKLYRAGADHVVSPNVSGAIRMASMLLRPDVVTFLDIATRSDGLELRFEQAAISEDSKLAGLTLMQAKIPQETGLIVIAVRKRTDETHTWVFNPAADTMLAPGDQVIVLGQPNQVEKLKRYAGA